MPSGEPARASVIAQRCSMTARQHWFGTTRYEAPRQHNRGVRQNVITPRPCWNKPRLTGRRLRRLWIFSETATAALTIFIGAMFCSGRTSWGQHMQSKMWRDEMRNANAKGRLVEANNLGITQLKKVMMTDSDTPSAR